MMPRIETLTVGGSPMEVFLYEPAGTGPAPAIVLAMHIPGHDGIENDEFTLKTAERLAEAGYVVAVPFIFHWWPKSQARDLKNGEFRDDWTIADLTATMDLLQGMERVDPARVGIVGHCWGGRVAWLGAATDTRYRACVVFYGGRIRLAMADQGIPAIERAGDIPCPVAGFFGNEDSNPSPEDVDIYEAALEDAGVPHEFHRYDGAGHAFQNFPSPERYCPAQSEDAWGKALAFLGRELRP